MPAISSHATTPPVSEAHEEGNEHDEHERDEIGDQRGQYVRHSTDARAIGMDWNRSKMPLCMSRKSRNAV